MEGMKCDKCKYFKIACKPMMPFEQGLAICEKYNLEADFTNAQKLKRLTCTGGVTERQLNNT